MTGKWKSSDECPSQWSTLPLAVRGDTRVGAVCEYVADGLVYIAYRAQGDRVHQRRSHNQKPDVWRESFFGACYAAHAWSGLPMFNAFCVLTNQAGPSTSSLRVGLGSGEETQAHHASGRRIRAAENAMDITRIHLRA